MNGEGRARTCLERIMSCQIEMDLAAPTWFSVVLVSVPPIRVAGMRPRLDRGVGDRRSRAETVADARCAHGAWSAGATAVKQRISQVLETRSTARGARKADDAAPGVAKAA